MTKAVITLLATATAILAVTGNAELEKAIGDLQALGDDAKGSNQEYKDLKELVEAIEAQGDEQNGAGDGTDDETPKGDDGEAGDGDDAQNGAETQNGAGDAQNTAQDEQEVKPKKYNYTGVRMIGSKWHCTKDNYKKGFDTANECAEHFNG